MLALLALLATASVAGAHSHAPGKQKTAPPCWKVLTNDAFDGKVDGLYPLPTYSEAVSHLPIDAQSYSTIAEVIGRARQSALQQAGKGIKPDPARCGFALGATGGTTGSTTGNGGSDGKGPIPGVIDKVGSDNADSFPIALIVIAAIAGLLVLGGGAGYLVRRRQRSQAELAAASSTAQSDDDRPTTPPALGP